MRPWPAYLACSFGIGVFSAFNNFTLPLWLASFTSSYLLLGLLGNTRSFEGAFVSPLAGAWSDRTWAGWLGRRRPFVLFGGLASALLLALTPAIGRLPMPLPTGLPPDLARLAPAIVAIFLFTLAFNTMDDIHKALLADLTEGAARNRLAGLRVVVEMAGQVAILVLGFLLWREAVPDSAFAIAGALMALGVLVTVLGLREPPPELWANVHVSREPPHRSPNARPLSLWEPLRGAKRRARVRASSSPSIVTAYPGAAVFCLSYFAYWSGVNAVLPLVSVYTRDILGASVGEAQLLPALLLLSTTLLALPMARLGTRHGKRRVIAAGYAVMALSGLLGLVIITREQGAALFLLAGVGNAASMVLTIPLLADLVPRQHLGAATGILAASGSIAAPLASLVGGGLADLYGPRAIFALMAAMTCLALALMPAVRQPESG